MNSVVRSAVQRVLRPATRRASGACTQRRYGCDTIPARVERREGLDVMTCISLGFVLSVIWHRFQNPRKTFHERWLEVHSSRQPPSAKMS